MDTRNKPRKLTEKYPHTLVKCGDDTKLKRSSTEFDLFDMLEVDIVTKDPFL